MVVPENITRLDGNAFRSTESLVSLDLPATIAFIGDWCFGGSAIQSLTVRAATPPTLENGAALAASCSIYVPQESLETYKAAYRWSTHASHIQAIP